MSLCINPQCNTENSSNPLFCQACGSELLLEGRYRVVRRLSRGGFGTTYEVSDQNTPKVLKVLHDSSTKAVELFQREAQFLSSTNHPGIPKSASNNYFIYHSKNSQQPLHCLVMEKIEGENLKEYIKQKGQPIKGNLALKWLHELVTILDQVHSQDIIHRDIKPNNIMLKPDGRLALIDFGAVREGTGTEGLTETATRAGTEVATYAAGGTSIHSKAYAAPEQIEGHAIKQSDFFSLGRTFVFLLTAKEPNDSSMYDAYYNRINWRERALGVSPQLADLIDQMMAWTPRERPANTQAILQRLEQIDKTLPSSTPPISVDPSPSPPIKNNNGSEKAPSCPPSYLRFSVLMFIIGLLSSIIYMGIPMLIGSIFAMIFASGVKSHYEEGDCAKARKISKRAKTTLKITGTLSTILAVVVTAFAFISFSPYGADWVYFAFAGIINITISIRLLLL